VKADYHIGQCIARYGILNYPDNKNILQHLYVELIKLQNKIIIKT